MDLDTRHDQALVQGHSKHGIREYIQGHWVSTNPYRVESFLWICSTPHLKGGGYKALSNISLSSILFWYIEFSVINFPNS